MSSRNPWGEIFRFEVRYQLRQPLFYLITFVLSVLLFIAGTGDGVSGRLHLNAPSVILEQLLKWIYFVLFLLTAFVASAAVRDFDRRTSELFLSKPITRFDYLGARFAGAMVVSVLPYVIGTLALAVSVLMPDVDATRLGPHRLAPYAFALGVFIIPTFIALGAVLYAVASYTRSTLATYVGVVALFALSATAGVIAAQVKAPWVGQLLDPFGVMAMSSVVKYWGVEQLNTSMPPFAGMVLWNRVVWLTLGLGAFGLTIFSNPLSPLRPQWFSKSVTTEGTEGTAEGTMLRTMREFSGRTVLLQFSSQVRREMRNVFASFPFLGMLALGLFVLVQAASEAGNLFGMPVYPRTYLMVESLQGLYSVVLLLVVVLYSGEMIWKERALGLNQITDSMPTPNGVYLGAKLVALLLVIFAYLLVGVVVLVGFQLYLGYHPIEFGLYARGMAIATVYPMLMAVLACVCHIAARNRLMGYGFVIVFILVWDVLEELGFEHHLYRFASLPPTPYSDFSGFGPFAVPFGWYSLYWALVATVLVGVSILFWRSGTDDDWRTRWAEARARFRGAARGMIGVGVASAVAVGSWIYYNTNVLNMYVPSIAAADARARYEQAYKKYEGVELPKIVAVQANVDIFPERAGVDIRGRYRLRNSTAHVLRDIHVSVPSRASLTITVLPPHDIVWDDSLLGYRIFRLRTPMSPGDSVEVGFEVAADVAGFVNNGTQTSVVDNGTYFTKRDLFPVIGYDAHRQLGDAEERKERDLEPVLRFASINDTAALRSTPRAPDADRVAFDVTVSTSPDEIAVTSGALQRDWVEQGRHYFHFVAEQPITHHFAFVSAKYHVTRGEWNGVAIEVYHHPAHGANVPRMMRAAQKSLAYYSANFGPYQHRYLRIVEYPRYERDATSFPGMVAWSESMGFNARVTGAEAVDYPFYVTAHEIAHQWWGQQVVGANVQGVGTVHETLAQYSALMVMEHEFGRKKMRDVLAYEREWYLRGRAKERGEEASLALAERQDYVYYHKGALAMYALRDATGEAALNGALRRFLSRFALGAGPYATTRELLAELRAVMSAEQETLMNGWFHQIGDHDNNVVAATSRQ